MSQRWLAVICSLLSGVAALTGADRPALSLLGLAILFALFDIADQLRARRG